MQFINDRAIGRAIISLLLAATVLICPFIALEIHSYATTPEKGLQYFEDDFNRADGEVKNGWIYFSSKNTTTHTIDDGKLIAQDGTISGNNGVCTSTLERPMSEGSINQKVTVDIDNLSSLANTAVANVHLRQIHADHSKASDLSYFVEADCKHIRIGMVKSNWTKNYLSAEQTYTHNYTHQYKIEFAAYGLYPTTLTATLFDETDGHKAIVTVSAQDNTAQLQRYGTVALSFTKNSAGQNKAVFDNFVYTQTDTMKCYDDFSRSNGEIKNDWSTGSRTISSINDNVLKLQTKHNQNDYDPYVEDTAIMRPFSEASLNQIVSVDFHTTQLRVDPQGIALIARCQEDRPSASGYTHYIAQIKFSGQKENDKVAYIYFYKGAELIMYEPALGTDGNGNFITGAIDRDFRLQFSVKSISDTETQLVASFYQINDKNNPILVKTISTVDSTPELQSAGTAGVTLFDKYNVAYNIMNFTYVEQPDYEIKEIFPDDDAIPMIFSDNFDDENGNIHGVNDWIDQQFLLKGVNIASVKKGKLYIDNGALEGEGAYTNKIMRPMSEGTLNQSVSMDIENLGKIDRAEIDLRLLEIAADSDAVNNRHAMYACQITPTALGFSTRVSWAKGEIAAVNWEYKEGHIYRITASATGSLPTTLTATLYDLTAGGEIVATVTTRDESLTTANNRTAQLPGTVGISYQGKVPLIIDNFKYEQTDSVGCHDRFNRKSGKVGNNWVIGSGSEKTAISSAKLVMNNGGVNDMWGTALMRPMSEAAIDQYVGIEYARPDGATNLSAPIIFARSQTDTLVTVDGKQGFATYYAQLSFTGEWTSKISVYKVANDGVRTLLKEGTVKDYGSASTGTARLQLIAEGSNPTKLTAILYVVSQNRFFKVYNGTVYDNQPELQKAGTAGVSYANSTKTFTIDRFSYLLPQEQPADPPLPEDLPDNYMAYFSGTVASGEFGQWIELEPNKTYVYTVRLKKILNSGGFAIRAQYNPSNSGRIYKDVTIISRTYDDNTFDETIEFTVPKDAHIQQNGKARIKILVHEGGLGSVGYAIGFKVYDKNDPQQTNLLVNADFKKGLYGWSGHGVYTQGITEANILVSKGSGEVQLMKYDPLTFVRDDSDIYFDDGDWASVFGIMNFDANPGKISGRLVDSNNKPIKSATVLLTPGSLTAKTDNNGYFVFDIVPVDIYTLSVRLADGTEEDFDEIIDVKEESEVNIDLTYDENSDDFDLDFEYDEYDEEEFEEDSPSKKTSTVRKKVVKQIVVENDIPWLLIICIVAVCLVGVAVLVFVIIKKRKKKI